MTSQDGHTWKGSALGLTVGFMSAVWSGYNYRYQYVGTTENTKYPVREATEIITANREAAQGVYAGKMFTYIVPPQGQIGTRTFDSSGRFKNLMLIDFS
jgi:LDH2 family malate/lactate/ureidoglycolate dehydrogenase